MDNTIAIIQGSSRSDGDTAKAVNYLAKLTDVEIYDLNQLDINPFSYRFEHEKDDFHPTIAKIIHNHKHLMFATPVYWYSMSGQMKIFFDRISDLLKIHKPLGRRLRGKSMSVLSCSNDDHLVNGFYMPFIESAHYLGMHYLGDYHARIDEGTLPEDHRSGLIKFASYLTKQIKASTNQ